MSDASLLPRVGRSVELDEREADRIQRLLLANVEGRLGTYSALILNASRTGVCLMITDPAFARAGSGVGLEGIDLAELRIASHFGDGIIVTFPGAPHRLEVEVVRIFETESEGQRLDTLGCRLLRTMTSEEAAFLRVPGEWDLLPLPAAAPVTNAMATASAAPAAEAVAAGAAAGASAATQQVPLLSGPLYVMPGYAAPAAPASDLGLPTAVLVDGKMIGIIDLLTRAVEHKATDLHLRAGSPPRLRVDGELVTLGSRPLEPIEARGLVRNLLTAEQFARFEETGDLDVAYSLPGQARFRINVLRARGVVGMAIRRIPEEVPEASQLGLAPACLALAERPRGLVLVTGPTGSGKSTTLASMIQHVNRTRRCHILTMEDPIEFIHQEDQAYITQREIGRDTEDFASALKRAMRQDPNVILVGEMRDLETISLAVTAAETGHLVFATLHTTSAVLTVDRIVDVFPPAQQRQVRMQLADCLQGIVCQLLLPKIGGGVVCAQEVLMASSGVRSLIREGKAPQIGNMMQTGARDGMQTLEDALNDLIAGGLITHEIALAKANHPRLIEKAGKPFQRPAEPPKR